MAKTTGVPQVLAAFAGFMSAQDQAILQGGRHWAAEAENYMKQSAPWTDRTSNARNSLQGGAELDSEGLRCVLSGGMMYSPMLELLHSGAYAILQPTANRLAPTLPRIVSEHVKALGV